MTHNHETLEDIIRDTGLKYEKIAERMGYSNNGLWKLRRDPRKMNADTMAKMAEALDVPINRIFEAIKNFD
ncbi:helix-turn-helix domain-containing protein [Streptococcus mutans]|nr:helix-turn-helix domain-containing protein [Streptococcus mutans]MCB5031916.1 helix-turn-helix domain-containing protein [Streptococcus mutans]